MRRLVVKLMVALLAMVMPLVAVAVPAHADTAGDTFLSKINALRASKGVGPVRVDGNLTAFAQSWTDKMADADKLSHNPDLSNSPGDWTKAGENVGVGGDVDSLFDAFVASPHHYENLVDPAFNLVGIGVTVVDGKMWTTHDFESRSGKTTPTTTKPTPTTAKPTPTTATPAPTTPAAHSTPKPAVTVAPKATTTTTAPQAASTATTTVPDATPVALTIAEQPTVQAASVAVAPARIRLSLDQSRGIDPDF